MPVLPRRAFLPRKRGEMEFEIDDDPQDDDCDRCEADRRGGLREDHLLHARCERSSDMPHRERPLQPG